MHRPSFGWLTRKLNNWWLHLESAFILPSDLWQPTQNQCQETACWLATLSRPGPLSHPCRYSAEEVGALRGRRLCVTTSGFCGKSTMVPAAWCSVAWPYNLCNCSLARRVTATPGLPWCNCQHLASLPPQIASNCGMCRKAHIQREKKNGEQKKENELEKPVWCGCSLMFCVA